MRDGAAAPGPRAAGPGSPGRALLLALLLAAAPGPAVSAPPGDLPVDRAGLERSEPGGASREIAVYGIRNLVALADLRRSLRGGERKVEILPTFTEGPCVNLVTSDDPSRIVISLVVDPPSPVVVELDGKEAAKSPAARRHEIAIEDLAPDREYSYRVRAGEGASETHRFRENGYSFRYGTVKVIAVNDDYRISPPAVAVRYGGCPEGYLLPDQMAWIEKELAAAEADDTVRHVFLFAQEPVFPCGGHTGDARYY